MKAWPLALLLAVPALGGCMGGSTSAPPAASPPTPLPPRGTVARCLADWNGTANADARTLAAPPIGPYPQDGEGLPKVSPHGPFQVFVERTLEIGAPGTNPPPRCWVFFRFSHGYRGGPAKVSFPEVSARRGVYGAPTVNFGRNADVGFARPYAEDRDGRLRPAMVRLGRFATCLAAWNGPANAAVRAAAAPPRGPYPWFAHRPIRPQGGFEAFIGLIATIGGPVGTHPAPCAVYFWFPHGYRGRPALLSFSEVDLRTGLYGRPGINARKTMRFHPSGRVYTESRDGRLHPTARYWRG